jgi:hypothetical protein
MAALQRIVEQVASKIAATNCDRFCGLAARWNASKYLEMWRRYCRGSRR